MADELLALLRRAGDRGRRGVLRRCSHGGCARALHRGRRLVPTWCPRLRALQPRPIAFCMSSSLTPSLDGRAEAASLGAARFSSCYDPFVTRLLCPLSSIPHLKNSRRSRSYGPRSAQLCRRHDEVAARHQLTTRQYDLCLLIASGQGSLIGREVADALHLSAEHGKRTDQPRRARRPSQAQHLDPRHAAEAALAHRQRTQTLPRHLQRPQTRTGATTRNPGGVGHACLAAPTTGTGLDRKDVLKWPAMKV